MHRAGAATALFRRYADYNIRAFFVVLEDAEYRPATAQYCREVQTQFGLEMPVLINPGQDLPDAVGMPVGAVDLVTRCGEVVLEAEDQSDSDLRAAIDAAVGL